MLLFIYILLGLATNCNQAIVVLTTVSDKKRCEKSTKTKKTGKT